MSRLPQILPEDMDLEQAEVYKSINSGIRGRTGGPFTPLLYSPTLTSRVEQLGVYIRFESAVPVRQREMVICMISAQWSADFEWYVHAPLALEAGLPSASLDMIGLQQVPVLDDTADRAAHAFTHELLETKQVSDETYACAAQVFGDKGVVDLTGLIGYYSLLAMTLNTFQVDVPEDARIPWA